MLQKSWQERYDPKRGDPPEEPDAAPANAQIVHSGQACVVKEDNISERIYTIREGDTLVLQCLVKGHPQPQVRWTKTAGSASDKFQDTPIFNETLRIDNIQRVQGGRYYCKAENGVGVAAIKSIRVDVQSPWVTLASRHLQLESARAKQQGTASPRTHILFCSNRPCYWMRHEERWKTEEEERAEEC
ncbi:MAM domain-containing glycosylphosphatidylinositol anchor protein 1 [Bagarius yarrelli]|uniref:MAM domain-containing glycosylphosphatidylinositol anchor protein 1 n=1 Tax=Bagarius yarrelli TaxID=175774 RepID=A0A556V451_BAGYA|nr:MAM domain-containing glycosylphosphatidylinositol anchor protein 1 [Bagarius yarrelli]